MPHIGNFPERGCPKPLSIPPTAFVPRYDTQSWEILYDRITNNTNLLVQQFCAPVFLPHRARVTKLTLYGFKNVETGYITLQLIRDDREGTSGIMATCSITAWTGFQAIEITDILDPEIDNENYQYSLQVEIDPDAIATDNYFVGAKIDWN